MTRRGDLGERKLQAKSGSFSQGTPMGDLFGECLMCLCCNFSLHALRNDGDVRIAEFDIEVECGIRVYEMVTVVVCCDMQGKRK